LLEQLRNELKDFRERGIDAAAEKMLQRFKDRFCDVSLFVKELKERFSRWFTERVILTSRFSASQTRVAFPVEALFSAGNCTRHGSIVLSGLTLTPKAPPSSKAPPGIPKKST
jgi:hypothetical protein